ncbi:unnamed protein product [Parnassius mnemosyne]|uniref:Uncharacterized protein n=1 Tax=Parnassius mnemosyne TaxID=213953 RepID=A0AAV1L9R0_9NEOP
MDITRRTRIFHTDSTSFVPSFSLAESRIPARLLIKLSAKRPASAESTSPEDASCRGETCVVFSRAVCRA